MNKRWIPMTSALLTIFVGTAQGQGPEDMRLVFSNYVGGSNFEQIRDIATDRYGNVYVTGGTASPDYPTTEGAYDRTFDKGGSSLGSHGSMDVFVTKFSASGVLIWATLLGGPNYDRAYAIEVDDQGFVYVAGRAGNGFPTTTGALQEAFAGDKSPNSAYGKQDGFVTKLTPDGSALVWSTYVGDDDRGYLRDIDIDTQGNVYFVFADALANNPYITPGSFGPNHHGERDVLAAKISSGGNVVLWAGYFGGSGHEGGGPSIRVKHDGHVYVAGDTNSRDMTTTPGAYDRSFNGGKNDVFVLKITPDGSSIAYATYLGGSGNEGLETHNLAVDSLGNAYVSSGTTSKDFPVTLGAYQTSHSVSQADLYVSKISADGSTLLGSTFYGGKGAEYTEGIYATLNQEVIVGGSTTSTDFPLTRNALQATLGGGSDFFVLKLNRNFSAPLFATYLGGSRNDGGRTLIADEGGRIYIAGQTESPDWPRKNVTFQASKDTQASHPAWPVFQASDGSQSGRDGCLAKYEPTSVSSEEGDD